MKAQLEQARIFDAPPSPQRPSLNKFHALASFEMFYALTNFEIQKYYQNKPKFNGVYPRNNLPKIKDWVYITNPDEYESIGNH